MRIGVDCHILGGMFQGSRTYLLNLYKAIMALEPDHQFVFYGHFSNDRPFGSEVDYRSFPTDSRWRRLTYLTYATARKDRLDLYHSTYISPLVLPCRSLVTIHDVLFETAPQFFDRAFVLRSRLLVRRSARKAAQVHTISKFSQNLIQSKYLNKTSTPRLVPAGIDTSRFSNLGRPDATVLIREKYALSNYILTVGRLEPRKNHLGLVEAYARVKERIHHVGPLVIIGQPDFGYDRFLLRIDSLGLKDCVHILSDIPDADLPPFYQAARLFVYPSFAEGFGIPVLEAMASGTPVISSNTSAIPEVVGDGGLLVDPADITGLAEAISRMWEDRELADQYAARGAKLAAEWTWKQSARKYLDAIADMEQP